MAESFPGLTICLLYTVGNVFHKTFWQTIGIYCVVFVLLVPMDCNFSPLLSFRHFAFVHISFFLGHFLYVERCAEFPLEIFPLTFIRLFTKRLTLLKALLYKYLLEIKRNEHSLSGMSINETALYFNHVCKWDYYKRLDYPKIYSAI